MSRGFVFYGVSIDSLERALEPLEGSSVHAHQDHPAGTSASVCLNLPCGEFECEISLHTHSGQLSVEVKETPAGISADAVRNYFQSALYPAVEVGSLSPVVESGPPRIHQFGDSGLWAFHCPGCGYDHTYRTKPESGRPIWKWNGSMVAPTFEPSLLVNGSDPDLRCHLRLKQGRIEFCADSFHELAGKTVDCPVWEEHQEKAA